MNGFSFNVNTIGIPNVCTALWNLQHIKDLKMTEWSVETCSPIISSNKCCADVNNWLIVYISWFLRYLKMPYQLPTPGSREEVIVEWLWKQKRVFRGVDVG